MQLKRVLNSRLTAVGAGAAVLALLAGGAGFAAGQINSADVQNESLRGVDVKDGKLGLKELSPAALKAIAELAGEDGAPGTPGEDGEDGQDATLAGSFQGNATIATLGGSFATNATQIGTLQLDAGKYVINAYGFFDTTAADSPRTDGTHLMLALRGPTSASDAFGADYGTCFTGAFPQGDREATCQATRTITLDAPTTIRVIGFGYNEDQSGTGGGTFTVSTDVSAIELAAPAPN